MFEPSREVADALPLEWKQIKKHSKCPLEHSPQILVSTPWETHASGIAESRPTMKSLSRNAKVQVLSLCSVFSVWSWVPWYPQGQLGWRSLVPRKTPKATVSSGSPLFFGEFHFTYVTLV